MNKLGLKTEKQSINEPMITNVYASSELNYVHDNLFDVSYNNLIYSKKTQKLSQNQINFLTSKIAESKLNVSEISQAYNDCRSTYLRLKNLYLQNIK